MEKRNPYIDFIKFPLALLVIYVHAPGQPDFHINDTIHLQDLLFWICQSVSFLSNFAVGGFFIISGYLFFRNVNEGNYRQFYKKLKRRYNIYIPSYFLWVTLFILFVCFIYNQRISDYILRVGILNAYLGFDNIHSMFTKCYPVLYTMWYMRDLIVTLTLSPIIYYILRKTPYGMLGIFIIYLIVPIPTSSFFFVSVGVFIAVYEKTLIKHLNKKSVQIIVFTLALMMYVDSFINTGWMLIGGMGLIRSIIIITALYLITSKYVVERYVKYGSCSYFIFAFHPFIIEIYLKVYYTRLSLINLDLTIPYSFLYLLFPVSIYWLGYHLEKYTKKIPIIGNLLCAKY